MTNQIKPSVTNPTIADIYQNIESNKLILRPDFQRRFVWTQDHQEEFIDTILKGYPFPEIYVCQGEIDIKRLKTTQHVIDGQQRLTTIKNYIDGENEKPLKKIPQFDQLSEQEREDFLSYQIVVRDIGRVQDRSIREIFRRINLTKFKVNDVEIHNVVYNGHFIRTAKEILEDIPLSEYGVFYESEFTRMADLYFVLLVMATLENQGYFPQDKEVETYIAEFNDGYPNRTSMKALLLKTFSIISNLNLADDSIWFRKSNFFTLVIELANKIDTLPTNLYSLLLEMEKNILANKLDRSKKYGKYYSYMYSSTTSRNARVIRGEIFVEDIFISEAIAS